MEGHLHIIAPLAIEYCLACFMVHDSLASLQG